MYPEMACGDYPFASSYKLYEEKSELLFAYLKEHGADRAALQELQKEPLPDALKGPFPHHRRMMEDRPLRLSI
ncbi:hypothetical protein [Paenibacillus hexagrammi]|uniref:Uncharacterized protein n=1 Tax=Paenibacillus hexagrammi TaxID=2908839 RepID=A0ABY3SLT2_9BACL|nr:hypothetical protein [Paenibacillus sp. YPD9-1]UJF34036.1 hypothetical protein L0M14_01995 [Paenibacillus sp. YPD9-1]